MTSRYWLAWWSRVCRVSVVFSRGGWQRLWLAMAAALPALAAPEASEGQAGRQAPEPLKYFVIVTGEELLRGVYPDGHTHYLTRTLRPLGCRCVGSIIVDDSREDLQAALRFAASRARLIIVTGGLGPTSNDVTREALAEFTQTGLAEHPEVLAEMERRYGRPRDQIRENLRRQTRVPVGGKYLKNGNGSAVGLVFEGAARVIVALPGPPRELQAMVAEELVPYLRGRFGVQPPGSLLTMRFVGVGQSQIDQVLRDEVKVDPDVFVSSLFDGMRVDFTFALAGGGPAEQARLRALEQELLKHLGDYFYADDERTLEECVVSRLRERGGTLALVEIGSGGTLADHLSAVAEMPQVLAGAYLAPTEERMRKFLQLPAAAAAGPELVRELGRVAGRNTESQWVVAVGGIQRPPGGDAHCWVAYGFPGDRWEVQRLGARGSGPGGQAALTTQILDRWRRLLRDE